MSGVNISDYAEKFLNTEDMKDFSQALIKIACDGGPVEKLQLLNNYGELRAAKVLKTALKKIVKSFKAAAKQACDKYISDIVTGINSGDTVVNIKTYETCARFFEKQYDEVADVIKEYYCYMFKGNLFTALFGERPYSEYYDYRKEKPADHE